jgi:hypothetical protein
MFVVIYSLNLYILCIYDFFTSYGLYDTLWINGMFICFDIDIYVYSKNPEMVTTIGYRTCHESLYEGSM